VLWFGQLVSNLPGIMTTLEEKVHHDDSEMVCLQNVKYALNYLVCPQYSGVGTVAAVMALATTLYSPILIFIALTFKVL